MVTTGCGGSGAGAGSTGGVSVGRSGAGPAASGGFKADKAHPVETAVTSIRAAQSTKVESSCLRLFLRRIGPAACLDIPKHPLWIVEAGETAIGHISAMRSLILYNPGSFFARYRAAFTAPFANTLREYAVCFKVTTSSGPQNKTS